MVCARCDARLYYTERFCVSDFGKTGMTGMYPKMCQGSVSLHATRQNKGRGVLVLPARHTPHAIHLIHNLGESIVGAILFSSSGDAALGVALGAVVVVAFKRDGLTDGHRGSKSLQIWLSGAFNGISALVLLVQVARIHNCMLVLAEYACAALLMSPAFAQMPPLTHTYVATCQILRYLLLVHTHIENKKVLWCWKSTSALTPTCILSACCSAMACGLGAGAEQVTRSRLNTLLLSFV